MKKSLFWLLSALAVGGLFSVTACDEEENGDVCAADVNPCGSGDYAATPYCYVDGNGAAACTGIKCGSGLSSDYTSAGQCVGNNKGGEGDACKESNDCLNGLSCYQGTCSSAAAVEDYKFVRIEDLSDACTSGKCSAEDPGADIDAIVLKKKAGGTKYAARVSGYHRGDGQVSKKADNTMAADPDKAIGQPDSFVHYPTADQCDYYKADVAGNDKANRQYTFVSLGGLGGYLEVEMEDSIEVGDSLDVLELGKCDLFNTNDDPNAKKGNAKAESIRVQVSISGDEGSWKLVGDNIANDTNKGILTFNITQL